MQILKIPGSGVTKGRDKKQDVHNKKKATKEFLNQESGNLEPPQDNKITDTKSDEKTDKEKSLSPDFLKDNCKYDCLVYILVQPFNVRL